MSLVRADQNRWNFEAEVVGTAREGLQKFKPSHSNMDLDLSSLRIIIIIIFKEII